MNGFSPIHSYVLGSVSVGLGVHALLWPRQEYARFGLPLEPSAGPSPTNTSSTAAEGSTGRTSNSSEQASRLAGDDSTTASPLVYLKGTRELSYGLALIALQYQDNSAGVTTVAGVMALAAVGDGLVVWFHGRLRASKAWGHWGAAVGLGSWAVWRAFVAYGEWAGFHALN